MAYTFFLLASIILSASSQSLESSGQVPSPTNIYIDREDGDFERCVCRPRVVINPPVCRRSDQIDSRANCSSTAHRENVSSELQDVRQRLEKLEEVVKKNQDTVASSLEDIKRQLEQLQDAVFGIVRILQNTHGLFPKDCSEALATGVTRSGVYKIQPGHSGGHIDVYCDMETDGGGWTVFQRRQDGSVDFYRDFANYSRGFGDLEGEFWLGNDNLHRLTAQGEYELRVDLSDFDNTTAYALYDSFRIANKSDNYRLTVGAYSGTAGDSLNSHSNQAFTTKDMDNDEHPTLNCAVYRGGAWWYVHCAYSNLNGAYREGGSSTSGVFWYDWDSDYHSLKYTDMKLRVKS